MSRLFVALDLPEDVRADVPVPQPPWRPVPRENLHVTLVFVGERPARHEAKVVAAVGRALRPAGALQVDLQARAIDAPRVMALPLSDPTGACGRLQAAVEEEIVAEGILHASRWPWTPHLTVGRLPGAAAGGFNLTYLGVPDLAFVPPSVSAYASTPTPDGSRYEVLERFPLPDRHEVVTPTC